jgi:hypothetical protein
MTCLAAAASPSTCTWLLTLKASALQLTTFDKAMTVRDAVKAAL